MKRGDKVPVTIGGHVVAQAEVKELDSGTATLVVPATLVVMGVRTELTDLPRDEKTTETIITGVDRASGESAAVGDTVNTGGTNADQTQTTQESTPGSESVSGTQTQEVTGASPVPDTSREPTNSPEGDRVGDTTTESTG